MDLAVRDIRAALRGLKAQQVRSPGQRPGLTYVPHRRPVRAKVINNKCAHTFALTGRGALYSGTQGVALGYELAALSGRSRRGLRGIAPERGAGATSSGHTGEAARAESPTSSEPRATPWMPCSPFLRPVRAKVKVNRLPILLPLQGVGVYVLIPRALPWAMEILPFQGAISA